MNQMNVYCDRENRTIIAESDWKVCPYCGMELTGQHGINRYDTTLPAKYEECTKVSRIRFQIKPWGFLEGLELRFDTPIPNMDASKLHTFDFVPYRHLDTSFHVFAKVRNV